MNSHEWRLVGVTFADLEFGLDDSGDLSRYWYNSKMVDGMNVQIVLYLDGSNAWLIFQGSFLAYY